MEAFGLEAQNESRALRKDMLHAGYGAVYAVAYRYVAAGKAMAAKLFAFLDAGQFHAPALEAEHLREPPGARQEISEASRRCS
jgi:hypothetical protein